MNCPACGEANRDGARFCISCGAPFELSCPSCGAKLPTKARFCDSCGATTDAPADSPQASDAAATRKTVTVVFADLTGSTSIGERMDPEAFRALMGPFYASMRSEVESRGGVIAKFQGDGVMALFGIPDVREDDAARALDAALAMQGAVAELPQRDAVLALRIGINTGEVVIGEMDEDLVGDTINVASRLEGAAAPGEVLVGEETWRLTRSDAAYEPVAPLALKGKAEPVPAFRLVALGDQGAEGSAAVFVGREREVSRLTAAFEEVIDASAARLVTIVGSPGLGKTRLAREFAGSLSDRAIVVETRCEAASSSTFAPVVDAIRSGAQIDEAADAEAVLARVEEIVPASEPERERIVRLVAALLGAGSPGSTEETFWAIRRMIEIGASNGPIVFVLDDMHWAEPVLLDLIEHLSEYIRSAPVLLVVTGRPELRDIRPSLVEGGRALAVVALEGLDQGSTTRLACELLGGDPVPEELLARLPSSTEGNPLFVRELVRMLVDDGVLQRTDGSWTVTIDVDAIAVPPTIHSLLAARVDRLRAEERTILEMASVIGREFYRGALAELVPAPLRATLDAHLESLRRKELVEPAGTYWIDEPVFHFHHVLIRDAAYRRLLKGARAELHERVARWLEDKIAGLTGEHDEAIGYHLEQAYLSRRQLGPLDDASIDVGRRAALLLGAEARRALDRDDHPAAAALTARALDVLDADDGVRAEPLILRCEALLGMGDVTDGTPAVRELERIATTERLAHWAMCFDAELANLTDPARLREIEKRVAAAASALESIGDVGGSAKAHTVHAATLARLGRFAECEDELDHALTAARERGDRGRITSVLGALPQAALWGPHPVSRAGGRCLDVVRLLRITTQSPAVEAISSRCQAVLEALRGRADAARGMLRKARRVQGELGLRHGLLETELAHGIVELVDGDALAAAEHLKIAHDGFLAMGVDASAAQAAALLGRAYLAMGEEDDAEAFADESERLGGDDVKTAIAWRAVRAEILARRGRIDEARALAERAVELAAATDAVIDHGDAYMALAAVHRASGDTAAAKSAEDRAIALYERKGASALVETRPGAEPTSRPQPALQRTGLENACTRAADRFNAAFAERDWKAIGELYSDDVLREDRRVGMRDSMVGRDAFVDRMKGAAEVGVSRSESTVLAIRGERLALRRVIHGSAADPTGFEAEMLTVGELDESGRVCRAIVFDASDLDGAMAELEERFIAGEAAPYAERLRVAAESMRRFNARDWDGWEQTMAPDHVFVDHRPASLGEIHRARGYVEASRALIELSTKSRSMPVAIHALAASGLIAEIHGDAVMADGGEFGLDFLALITVAEDRITRTEYFPVDRLDDARRRFAEVAEDGARLDNTALRLNVRADELWLRRDWSNLTTFHSADFVFVDRRSGLHDQRVGFREVRELAEASADIGIDHVVHTPIAIRGERLCLERVQFIGSRYEVDLLRVQEIDEDERLSTSIVFDEDDLGGALDELDARFIAGEGAPFAETIRVAVEFNRRSNARDWAGWQALMHPEHVLIDHRPASLGEVRGAAEIVNVTRTMIEFLSTSLAISVDFHAAPGACMSEAHVRGETTDGAPIEIELIALMAVRDGLVTRTEYFPLDQREAARARFAELAEPPSLLENECSRVAQRFDAHVVAREWDAAMVLNADDILYEDRRKGFADRRVGNQAVLDVNRSIIDVGVDRMERTPIAIRGEQYCLDRLHFIGASFEAFVLRLLELNDDGRFAAAIAFDEHDLAGAIAEMDDRYYAGEGAAFAPRRNYTDGLAEGIINGNWQRFRDCLAPNFVLIDHRPASLGELDSQGFIDAMEGLRGLVRAVDVYSPCIVAESAACSLGQFAARGVTEDGSRVEYAMWGLVVFRDGLAVRTEIYPLDRLDDALARFDEIESRATLSNDCSQVGELYLDRWSRDDLDGIADLLHPDVTLEDRRTGFADASHGRDAVMHTLSSGSGLGVTTIDRAVIALRGQRSCVERVHFVGPRWDVELLQLLETDDDGQVTTLMFFDADDLDGAMDELDDRFFAGEGKHFEDTTRRRGLARAINSQDWDAYSEHFASDFVLVDHRPASVGELRGIDQLIEYAKTLRDLVPTLRLYQSRLIAIESELGVSEIVVTGQTASGDPLDFTFVTLSQTEHGLIKRLENFTVDQLDEAMARFASLRDQETRTLANACTRTFQSVLTHFENRDWDAIARLYSDDWVATDRRLGLLNDALGREESIEGSQAAAAVGATRAIPTVVAVRGDRLSLVRVLFRGDDIEPGAPESEVLLLNRLDADGRIAEAMLLDPDDIDTAYDHLDERYIADEAAVFADVVRQGREITHFVNTRDWDAMRSSITDDFVLIDHRSVSVGTQGADAFVESSRVRTELMDVSRANIVEIHALAPTASLSRTLATGRTAEGVEVESTFLVLTTYRDGIRNRLEYFPPEQLVAARARFDELAAAPEPIDNDAMRLLRETLDALNARDWERFRRYFTADFRSDDHRPGLTDTVVGVDNLLEMMRVVEDLDIGISNVECVAMRGSRLALARVIGFSTVTGGESEVELLQLCELDESGLQCGAAAYTPEQLSEAMQDLEERFARREAKHQRGLDNEAMRVMRKIYDAVNARDWDRYTSYQSPEQIYRDRRPGFSDVREGVADNLEHMRVIDELDIIVPEITCVATRGSRLALARITGRSSRPDAGFEVEMLFLLELDELGRASQSSLYEPKQLIDAIDELDDIFARGEGAEFAPSLELGRQMTSLLNERDFDAVPSLLSDDFVFNDHRPVGWSSGDDWLASFRALNDLVGDFRYYTVAHRELRPNGALASVMFEGTTKDGATWRDPRLGLSLIREGRFVHLEQLPEDQLDEARARFEELMGAEHARTDLENDAMRALRALDDRFLQRDWEGNAPLLADSYRYEDRRPGMRDVRVGRDAAIDAARAAAEVRVDVMDTSWVATRGKRLALARTVARSADTDSSFETELLRLVEIDEDGKLTFVALFDGNQLSAATVELDERYISGEGAPFAAHLQLGNHWLQAMNARDIAALRALTNDDFFVRDHRPASLGEIPRDAYLESLETLFGLMAEFRYTVRRYLATSPSTNVSEVLIEGRDHEGGEIKMTLLGMGVMRDDRFAWLEVWPEERLDDVLERFDEIASAPEPLENTATRSVRSWIRFLAAEDWDRYVEIHRSDCLVEDKRKGIQSVQRGPEEILEVAKGIAEIGPDIEVTVHAIRGDRLALIGLSFVGDFRVDTISVCEVDADGRFIGRCQFDPESVDEAFQELDARFIAGEGAPYRELVSALSRVVHIVNTEGRIDEIGHAEDIVLVDHRPASFGEIQGRDALIEWVQALDDLSERRLTTMPRFHRLAPDGAVAEVVQEIETTEGAGVELRFLAVSRLHDGQIARIEYFPVDRLSEALTRFEELAGESELPPLENACTRLNDNAWACLDSGDYTTLADHYAEDAEFEDRRAGFGWKITGRDEFVANIRASFPGTVMRRDVLAIRGERLELDRISMTSRGFEVQGILLNELDEDGRLKRSVFFDVDDVDAAYEELDERFVAAEGAPYAEMVRLGGKLSRASNADQGTSTGFLDNYAPDVAFIDHRPASFGEIRGRDAVLEWSRALEEITSHRSTSVARYHRLAPDRAASEVAERHITSDGAAVEGRFHAVAQRRGDQLALLEFFPLDRLDDALARFDELGRGRFEVENACTRVIDRMYSAGQAALWDAMGDLYALDGVYEDRRPGFRNEVTGRDTLVEHAKLANAGTDVRWEHLAIRGDRLALTRLRATIRDGFEVIVLGVHEIDAEDRLQHTVLFDGDDVDVAFDELDDRHLASAEATERDRLRVELIRAQNAGDWDRVKALLSDDFVLIDRRSVSFATAEGAERYIDIYTSLSEVLQKWRTRVVKTSHDPYCSVVRTEAVDRDGNEVAWDVVSVSTTRDGKLTRIESFEIEQLDEAIVRARELEAADARKTRPENACTRALDRSLRAQEAADWDALRAVSAPDVGFEDRRPGLRTEVSGREHVIEHSRLSMAGTNLQWEHVATRGDRLALCRIVASIRDGFEIAVLNISELDEQGRIARSVMFEADDLDAAFTELDSRWLSSDETTDEECVAMELVAGLNAGDRSLVAAPLSDDFAFVDRRSVSMSSATGAAAFLDLLGTLWDVLPQMRIRVLATRSDPPLGVARTEGVDENGNEITWDTVVVPSARNGKLTRIEFFDPERYDDAVARARELESASE